MNPFIVKMTWEVSAKAPTSQISNIRRDPMGIKKTKGAEIKLK